MIASYRKTWLSALALAIATIACPASLWADEPAAKESKTPAASVELFQAMKDGQLDVKLIQMSDREANILLTNKTKQPLSVKIPEAWASVPVLAQRGGGGRGGARGGGGGAQRGGGGAGRGGGGGAAFNVPAEKMTKVECDTVCLDHGLADPNPHMAYEIRPIDEVSTDPQLHEVLKMLGRGELNQRAAQAATWHLSNQMSWEELANKEVKRLGSSKEPYFSRAELQAAVQIVNQAKRLAAAHPAPVKPVEESRSTVIEQ